MRLLLAAVLLAATAVSVAAEELPDGVDQLLTCRHVYSLSSEHAREAGDEGTATEYAAMGDTLYWQAVATLEGAGYSVEDIDNIDMNSALITGFSYGSGEGEAMLADCLAAWDSP